MIKIFLLKIYTIWVYVVFTVFMILLLPLIIIPFMIDKRYVNMSFTGIRIWAYIFSKLTFIKYRIYDSHNVEKKQAYIYISNHNSFLDAPALPLAIPGYFRPLGKVELTRIPVFGLIIRSIAVLVDRSNPESRKKSVERLNQVLKKGISIFIFPEGTTNKTDKPLTPFYDGAFRIAIENQTPILPMVIINTKNLMPRGKYLCKPGTIKVYFCSPIETKGLNMEDLPGIKSQAYHTIERMVIEKSNEDANAAFGNWQLQ